MSYRAKTAFIRVWTSVLAAVWAWTLPLRADDINVFAASSLTEPMKAIQIAYEAKTADKVLCNFGASSALARQIDEGAPADLFISADEAKMDGLEKNDRILKETRKDLLGNQLVVVAATNAGVTIRSVQDLAKRGVTYIALGDPKSVPIGVYAREYLVGLGLWAALESKIVPTENVKAAMAAVEAGNADASIVYKTDATISQKVKIVFEVPVTEGPKIIYPAAVVEASEHVAAAQRYLDFLGSPAAGNVFRQYGFIVLVGAK